MLANIRVLMPDVKYFLIAHLTFFLSNKEVFFCNKPPFKIKERVAEVFFYCDFLTVGTNSGGLLYFRKFNCLSFFKTYSVVICLFLFNSMQNQRNKVCKQGRRILLNSVFIYLNLIFILQSLTSLINDTAAAPNNSEMPATTIMWLCTDPTILRSVPPITAAMICGIQMVPLNKPR